MKSRKTISLAILLFAAVLPLFLSAVFLGGRVVIRYSMLKSLKEEKVTTILLPENELQWYKKNHEILVDGKMFDVKSIQLADGVYEITGLFDEMETELNAILEELNNEAGSNQDKSISIYLVCLGIISESPLSNFDSRNPQFFTKTKYSIHGSFFLSKGFFHPFFTPPRG